MDDLRLIGRMRDRPSRSANASRRSEPSGHRFSWFSMPQSLRAIPAWAILSLISNGLLIAAVVISLMRDPRSLVAPPTHASITPSQAPEAIAPPSTPGLGPELSPELGPRHQLSYQQWQDLLQQEAEAIAENQPSRLSILLGDSISLWFPPNLLPSDRTWLNQGISGEISSGLLNRLSLIDQTQPETIFVMIGINDLIREFTDETIVANQRLILQDLKAMHPDAQIVLQSILPHGGEKVTWEGKDRLLKISNDRIWDLNQRLKAIALEQNAYYLDLYPLFTDEEGVLRSELSTDGLHLSREGYMVWRSALQLYSQIELERKD